MDDVKAYFRIEGLVRKRARRVMQARDRKTYELIIDDPRSIARLLRATYEWLDDKTLVNDILIACDDLTEDV